MTAPNNRKPDRQGIWEVSQAASYLSGQACTLSARHIQNAMLRLQFNREVAYYAQDIVKDVDDGRKSVEEGLQAIGEEQQSLLDQAAKITKHGIGLVAGTMQIAGGRALCLSSRGALCTLGILTAAHGINNGIENSANLLTGSDNTQGPLRKFYHFAAGLTGSTETAADIAYGTIDITLSLYAMGRKVVKPGAWRLFRYLEEDKVIAIKTMSKKAIIVDASASAATAMGIKRDLENLSE